MAASALGLVLAALRLEPGIEFAKALHRRGSARVCLTSLSTLPLSLSGRPRSSANAYWLTSAVNDRVHSRLPSPQIFATAIVVLSCSSESGTQPHGRRGTPRWSREDTRHNAPARLRQAHAGEVQLLPHTADHRDRISKIHGAVCRVHLEIVFLDNGGSVMR